MSDDRVADINVHLGRDCEYCGKPLAEGLGSVVITGEVVSEPLEEPVLIDSETLRYYHKECERDD